MKAIMALVEKEGLQIQADASEQAAGGKRGKNGILGTKSMEQMLWNAACSIRGEKDAPKFKDYILPLVFIKRLSDVFEDEIERLAETYGDRDTALEEFRASSGLEDALDYLNENPLPHTLLVTPSESSRT